MIYCAIVWAMRGGETGEAELPKRRGCLQIIDSIDSCTKA